MSKHQLILSKYVNNLHPVRSLGKRLEPARQLVLNSSRSEEALNDPSLCLVAPGDVLEVVVASDPHAGAVLWILESNDTLGGNCIDLLDTEVMFLPVDRLFDPGPGEQRRKLWISDPGQEPLFPPDDGTGNAGTMVAIPPLAPPDSGSES
ncbi:hypothetical protein HJC10_01355 [Corallococcus exiguus]|uniref:hypothetical protein n=1 Tax=Corallococcus TaxID=83461 RepID=UPI000EEF60CA|nr:MULTISPECIES: hypothetical protein [Corallococcus]NNC01504.1 hypothetical protein [Corallococcus exiguus]NPC47161.1 hypothetical protein [Corallococcus exiguus]RKH86837.1 hypothetical protein D7X99_02215 [Corallococcus sp. AB032C]